MFRTSSVHHQERFVEAVLPHTKVCKYSSYKMLLMVERRGPKHVELNLSAD